MADEEDDDEQDIYVCHACVGDAYLKKETRTEGRRRKCNFCSGTRKAIALGKLADRIRYVFEEHHHATPSQPEGAYDSESGWERRGDPAADLFQELAGIEPELAEAICERLSEETAWDAHDGGYEDPYGDDALYEERTPDTHDLHGTWGFFRKEIGTRSRFFGTSTQKALDEIFGDIGSLKTWEGRPAIKKMGPKDDEGFLYRARIAQSEAEIQKILTSPVSEIGPPPSRLARAGRMNAAGISVFYGAIDAETCIAEVRAPVGSSILIGKFELIRAVRLLDLDVLTHVVTEGSWFAPDFTERSNRAAFLKHLVKEISRPVMPSDEEFEYLATQVVSEYLAACVKPPLDGILFQSAQTGGEGRNIVLFHHAAAVESYDLPKGTTVDVHMGWATDDDYDDTIFVSETVPPPERKRRKKKPEKDEWAFDPVAFAAIPFPDGFTAHEEDLREPSLRLDVKSIGVCRIKSVRYTQSKRSVLRHRQKKTNKRRF